VISLLLPSRGRPDNVRRLVESVRETASQPNNVEIVVAIDDDDPELMRYLHPGLYSVQSQVFSTERTTLSEYWNLAYKKASGDILGHMGDDIVMKTPGWDTIVTEAFDQYPDKIVLVYGDDGDPTHANFGTHSFVSRRWVETLGYMCPPYFSSDYNDTWLNELADGVGRKHRVPILTEHMHFALGKGTLDLTHAQRLVRHWEDDVTGLYESKADERARDIEKLKAAMF
jgi:glycosyltransferase involved in cell wall biosynthesis